MGLVKRAATEAAPATAEVPGREELIAALGDPGGDARRRAALRLAGVPEARAALLARVGVERDAAVRDALLTSLVPDADGDAARALAAHLRSEDAALRNAVVETLAQIPATAEIVPTLLGDPDPDVRVLCVMTLTALRHPGVPAWLLHAALHDAHPNVVGAAVGELAELGGPEASEHLDAIAARFPEDPFIAFVVDGLRARAGDAS